MSGKDDFDQSFVLWNGGGPTDENEPGSPVLFQSTAPGNEEKSPQQHKEELYKLYEQLTEPIQDFTLRDFVAGLKPNISIESPSYNVAKPRMPTPPSPKKPSLHEELSKEVPSYQRSPLRPTNRVRPSPASETRSPRRSNARNVPIVVEHGSNCHICKTSSMIIKTRCLVCGKVYCRSCVKEGMGSMLEGRKCKSCLGHRYHPRYISRAGQGWWISSRVKQAEMKWATRRSRSDSVFFSGRSF